MSDLTVIFITANEHPESWVRYHREVLDRAIEGHSLITVSREPGSDIHDTEPQSHYNMYRQLLRACKLAKTKYVATAESDTLYPPEHYNFYRPPDDAVAYDMSRWLIYTWNRKPVYSMKYRISNCTLIAPREYYIEALEERYGEGNKIGNRRVGEVGRRLHEDALGLKPRTAIQVWCPVPTIQVNHPNGTNFKETDHPTRKRLGELKAYDIPYWGPAEDVMRLYNTTQSSPRMSPSESIQS